MSTFFGNTKCLQVVSQWLNSFNNFTWFGQVLLKFSSEELHSLWSISPYILFITEEGIAPQFPSDHLKDFHNCSSLETLEWITSKQLFLCLFSFLSFTCSVMAKSASLTKLRKSFFTKVKLPSSSSFRVWGRLSLSDSLSYSKISSSSSMSILLCKVTFLLPFFSDRVSFLSLIIWQKAAPDIL